MAKKSKLVMQAVQKSAILQQQKRKREKKLYHVGVGQCNVTQLVK